MGMLGFFIWLICCCSCEYDIFERESLVLVGGVL